MEHRPSITKVYHPSCGSSYYYALVRKRYKKEVTDENGVKTVLHVRVYMCRKCAEEFSDLDIMEDEAKKPQVDLSSMTDEQRKAFIASLFPKKELNGKPTQ